MALVYPCSHFGAGECKAAGLIGLALAWYAADPLCLRTLHAHTHLHGAVQWDSLGATKHLEPDATHAPVVYCETDN